MRSPTRKKKLFFRAAVTAAVVAGGIITLVACGNQAEGERCNHFAPNGGNDDCQDGLQCTLMSDLSAGSDICCPPNRTLATTAICMIKHTPPGGDAGPPPPDSSPSETSTSDSATPDAAGD